MNAWLTPQISLQVPNNIPIIVIKTKPSFKRPGHASNLIAKAGIDQLCNTSRDVTKIRMFVSTGTLIETVGANKRKAASSVSFDSDVDNKKASVEPNWFVL